MITEKEKKLVLQIQPLLAIDMDSLEGKEFEKYCAGVLKELGYINIKLTPGSGDYGIDILAEKGGLVYGFQCKRYSNNIGVRAVQEASSGAIYYNCDRAIVVTNNLFTPAAINMAKKIGVILWDRKELEKALEIVLQNTVKKINQEKRVREIKAQEKEPAKEELLKCQKILDPQSKHSYAKLEENIANYIEFQGKKEKRSTTKSFGVESEEKQKKQSISKVLGVVVLILVTITAFVMGVLEFQHQKTLTTLQAELYSISQKYNFTITNIAIEERTEHEFIISSSNFNNLQPNEMYLFYSEFQEEIDNLNISGYIKKIECGEDMYTFPYPYVTVVLNGDTIYDQAEEDKKKRGEELRKEYGQDYPQIGMREEILPYTILGEPKKITKCKDFDYLLPRAQSKKYEWGESSKPGYFSVTVQYQRHRSNRFDDYVEYPPDNGYVYSIYYYDKNGRSHHIDERN